MRVVIDNITFAMQKAGGNSVVWYEFINRILSNDLISTYFIEYYDYSNIFREHLLIPDNLILKRHSTKWLPIQRYVDERVEGYQEPFIFHSSYYRLSSNPRAINVTTVHDFTYEYFKTGIRKYVHCKQKYRALRKAQYIICISENTKKDLIKFLPDIDIDKIRVVYNGVSDDYKITNESNIDFIPFKKNNYILFVGARASYKNFKFVVESLKGTSYNLVISGGELNDNELSNLQINMPNRWYYTGRVSNYKLNQLYNGAYALLYPSSYEGFGIPVLEAQKAGCPVIAYNSSSIPEVIGDSRLLLNELTSVELQSKLSLLEDTDFRNSVIQKGLKNAQRFTWEKTYKETITIYEEALNNANYKKSF